jgi:O-antigen/teichoic acid export membrane protein
MLTPLLVSARRAAASDFARNGALVFGAILFGNAFNYAYLLLLGRVLSVLDYGIAMSLISAVLLVNGAGSTVQTVTAKLAADLRAAGDLHALASFTRAISRLSLFVAAGLTVIVFAFQGVIADYLHLSPVLVVIAGTAAALGFTTLFQRGCFQGTGAFVAFALALSVDAIRPVIVVPATRLFGVTGGVVTMLIAVALAVVYGAVSLSRQFPSVSATPWPLDLRRMIKTAGAAGTASFGVTGLMFYDVVLARHFLNPVEAGLYGAAALIGRVIFVLISFLPTILIPHIAVRSRRGESLGPVLVASAAASALVIVPIGAFSAIAPQLVIRMLAGSHFVAGAPLVLPYVFAAGALAFANVLSAYAVGRHRFGFVPYLWLIAVAEVTVVSVRHAFATQIIEDILVGHIAVCVMMVIWTLYEMRSERNKAIALVLKT